MRPKVLTPGLCAVGVILGQNEPALVGLPEVGVTLTGSAEHPEIVNNSGLDGDALALTFARSVAPDRATTAPDGPPSRGSVWAG